MKLLGFCLVGPNDPDWLQGLGSKKVGDIVAIRMHCGYSPEPDRGDCPPRIVYVIALTDGREKAAKKTKTQPKGVSGGRAGYSADDCDLTGKRLGSRPSGCIG